MRRSVLLVALLAVVTALGAAGPAAASTTTSLNGKFTIYWPRPASDPRNAPCDAGSLCGAGSLRGFGAATITIEDDEFFDIEGSPCIGVDRIERLHLVDGSGDAILTSTGTFCFPGRSGDARDEGSYGNPSFWSFDFTVDGAESTGVFSGATGSGQEMFFFAGAVGGWTLTGSVTAG
jgi:hypothetical protein